MAILLYGEDRNKGTQVECWENNSQAQSEYYETVCARGYVGLMCLLPLFGVQRLCETFDQS